MTRANIYSAIGTPLSDSGIHVEGLAAHLDDQWEAGMDGILVAGTMGAMPLLTGDTYEQLLRQSAVLCRGRGPLLVGVGDLSYARTLERIELANQLDIDGVVVLSPFFLTFSQQELIAYYSLLVARSHSPLFLYDLPQRTGIALEIDTVLRLAEHPRIAGIKISGDLAKGRQLLRELQGADFSVYFAEATALDLLIRSGIRHQSSLGRNLLPRSQASQIDCPSCRSRQQRS